jgi:ABC-type sugar transport system ATPase subunit
MENFITEINIDKSRNIYNLDIPLSLEKRQHLILTGKNGCGKTSLLLELIKRLSKIDNGEGTHYDEYVNQLNGACSYTQKNTN